MELEKFVEATLRQLIGGVSAATEFAREKGAVINPQTLEFYAESVQSDMWCEVTGRISSRVEFDIAVTATEATGTTGGIGVFLAPLRLGAAGNSDSSSQNVNRIRFPIQVLLPTSEPPKPPKRARK